MSTSPTTSITPQFRTLDGLRSAMPTISTDRGTDALVVARRASAGCAHGENQGPAGFGRETSGEMNAGPRTGLRRQVPVPAPEQKQGVRAGRDDDVPSDGVARRAGGDEQGPRSPSASALLC